MRDVCIVDDAPHITVLCPYCKKTVTSDNWAAEYNFARLGHTNFKCKLCSGLIKVFRWDGEIRTTRVSTRRPAISEHSE